MVRILRSVGLLSLSLRLFFSQISMEIGLVPGISARKISPSSRVTPTITLLALNSPAFKSFKGDSRIKYNTRGQKIRIAVYVYGFVGLDGPVRRSDSRGENRGMGARDSGNITINSKGPEGVLPYKRLMGKCRWMGSNFHHWTGRIFNSVARMVLHIF